MRIQVGSTGFLLLDAFQEVTVEIRVLLIQPVKTTKAGSLWWCRVRGGIRLARRRLSGRRDRPNAIKKIGRRIAELNGKVAGVLCPGFGGGLAQVVPQSLGLCEVEPEREGIARFCDVELGPDVRAVGVVEGIVWFGDFVGWMFRRAGFMEEVGRQRLGGFRRRHKVRATFIQHQDPLVVHLDPGARGN